MIEVTSSEVVRQLGRPPKFNGLTLLAVEKSIGAAFFLVASLVLLGLWLRGVTHPLQSLFAAELEEDPHDLLATFLIGRFPQVSRQALLALLLVSTGYLVLHLVEAAGLWLARLWVEYLVLVETAAFLPYEVFEIARHPTWFKGVVLVLNAVIVGYLVRRRLQSRHTRTTLS